MTPWQRLGVDRQASKRDIKRAYSKLIKTYRPDESPVEFQQIREAYELALDSIADEQSKSDDAAAIHTVESTPIQPGDQVSFSVPPQFAPQTPDSVGSAVGQINVDPGADVNSFVSRFEKLISRFPDNGKLSANEFDQYREEAVDLMRNGVLSNWWEREYISDVIFELICQNIDISRGFLSTTTNIPSQFLHYFDQYFLWSQNEFELRERYDNDGAGLIFYGIGEATKANYPNWDSRPHNKEKTNENQSDSKRTFRQRFLSFIKTS